MSFNPAAWQQRIRQAVRPIALRGLALAGAAMAADVRRAVGVEWGGVPSRPGQPPKMRTGELRNSIFWEVDDVNMRVYVIADTPYAFYLEFGTLEMAPRPVMRGTLAGVGSLLSRYVSVAFAAPSTPVDTSFLRGNVRSFAGAGT